VIGAEPRDRQLLFARLGVAGCLPERIDPQGLGKAIHMVSSGRILFYYRDAPQPPYVAGDVPWLQQGSLSALTQRETEILHRAAEGLGDRQIGQSLTMAQSTVRMHLRSVYRKLRVRNRAQAVAVAAANGLLDNATALMARADAPPTPKPTTLPLLSESSWRRET
jgi:DNA-binding NarL/FixJ family response regulator